MNISDIRKEYKMGELHEESVLKNPIEQFRIWFNDALTSQVNEPNAMVLSTVDSFLQPHSRVVLLKNISKSGLTFFTNYASNKGKEISANNKVSLLFFWPELERQVRIEGIASKIDRAESEAYFKSRPRESQLGAHASHQSSVIKNRNEIENSFSEVTAIFDNKDIPLPEYWGGYLVVPSYFEFWQGRPNRLHDRIAFVPNGKDWKILRLAP